MMGRAGPGLLLGMLWASTLQSKSENAYMWNHPPAKQMSRAYFSVGYRGNLKV